MKKQFTLITAIFTIIAINNMAGAAEFEKILRHEYTIADPEKIVLQADIGDIELVLSESGIIAVDVLLATKSRNQAKADTAFSNITTEFLQPDEGVARINVRTKKSGFSWFKFWKRNPDVSIRVTVPDGIILDISSGVGDVSGGSFSADMDLATGAGDVDLVNLTGSLDIATGAGDVDLRGFEGDLDAATGAGDFDASGTFSKFHISTGKGDVRLLVDNPISANSSVSTGMGDIDVGLPVGSSFLLDAEVGFGKIKTDFDIVDNDPDEKSFRGTYNEGSTRLGFSTGFGDVSVSRR